MKILKKKYTKILKIDNRSSEIREEFLILRIKISKNHALEKIKEEFNLFIKK